MYIPSFNRFDDLQGIVAFMQRYSFATIITVKDDLPIATHLPFVVKQEGERVILRAHFAMANSQAADSAGKKVLVIFAEPHAYISPKNYEKADNVPTWNYVAVHAYGTCSLLRNEEDKSELLKETISYFEADYLKQWEKLNIDFRQKMMKGITAFEIKVDDLQAKRKLSQNRSAQEFDNIITGLSHAGSSAERDIAAYMKMLKNNSES